MVTPECLRLVNLKHNTATVEVKEETSLNNNAHSVNSSGRNNVTTSDQHRTALTKPHTECLFCGT